MLPLTVVAEVVESGGGDCDVEGRVGKRRLADIGLNRGHDDGRGSRVDALDGAVEHVAAEIDQRHGTQREVLQQLERVIPRTAPDIEQRSRVGAHAACRLGDKFERQRRVDGGGLASFEVGEAVDIGIEAAADFLGAGLVGGHGFIMTRAVLVPSEQDSL